jgi:hypothetical protein
MNLLIYGGLAVLLLKMASTGVLMIFKEQKTSIITIFKKSKLVNMGVGYPQKKKN